MSANPGGEPRQPPRWEWTVSVLSALGAAAGEVLANQASSLGWITWPCLGLAAVWLLALTIRQVRSRRARALTATDPAPTVRVDKPGQVTGLPYATGFTGRADDVKWIVETLGTTHAVVVFGRRAVGTSSCAVQAANTIRDASGGDARIAYLDLRPGGRALSPRQVLTELAQALRATPPASGRDGALRAAAAGLSRGLSEYELLVLDNVDDPAQIQALFPPTSPCRLLVAGAAGLARLEGVAQHEIEEPELGEAVELLATAAGQRTSPRRSDPRSDPRSNPPSDPRSDPAVRAIVELCGRQPRTIRALGYRMARHGWRSDDLLVALRYAMTVPVHHPVAMPEALRLLTLLTDLDQAYAALSRPARRLYRRLALAPAPLDRPMLTALDRWRSGERLDRVLDELAVAGFVRGAEGDRYEIRPPLAEYARLHLLRHEPIHRRVAAQRRLLRYLARRAERLAVSLTAPGLPANPAGGTGLPFDDDPHGWFELNGDLLHGSVEAAVGGATPPSDLRPLSPQVRRAWFRLAVGLCGWYAHENWLDDWEAVCETVLGARTVGDRPEIAGWAHNERGVVRRRKGDPGGAVATLTLALAQRGRRGIAQAHLNLGLALLDLRQLEEATEHLELARRHRAHADRGGQALSDLALGAVYLAQDKPEPAQRYLIRAANTFRAIGEPRGYAAALADLVLAQWRLGEHLDAAQSWTAALREYEALGDRAGRAATLLNAGAILVHPPARPRQAYDLLRQGLRLRERMRPSAGFGRTLLHLGTAAVLRDRPAEARECWIDAARICAEVGDPDGEAAATFHLSA